MLPASMYSLIEKYEETVKSLENLGFIVETRSGVSDMYYEFIGCTKKEIFKYGSEWLFTAENVSSFIDKTEIFLLGFAEGLNRT